MEEIPILTITNIVCTIYLTDKYYHFYSVCFGLGWIMALYRPFESLLIPSIVAVFFTIMFEVLGKAFQISAHTRRCKGKPYDKKDIYWGFCFALVIAYWKLRSYHVYTMSYGCGIIVFSLRGAIRKHHSLKKLRRQRSRR